MEMIAGGITLSSESMTSSGQGVIPVTESYTVSKIRGQHRTKPHSDRSSRVGQAWGRHSVIDALEASSRVTGEPIKVNILGPVDCCPECKEIPRWDSEGNLVCGCATDNIKSGPSAKPPREDPDSANERALRNQNFQKDMRRFFKKGGRC
jgi:hypothetical protein